MFNSYRLLPVHGIEPREGAILQRRKAHPSVHPLSGETCRA